eukprot:10494122-Lingulodinium_polyedra.AAC.1
MKRGARAYRTVRWHPVGQVWRRGRAHEVVRQDKASWARRPGLGRGRSAAAFECLKFFAIATCG